VPPNFFPIVAPFLIFTVEESMSVSPTRQARNPIPRNRSNKAAKQGWVKRMLRLEALEQRQLMAADIMPFHNYLAASDVNGDFAISPLDALVIINKLNAEGSGPLTNQSAPVDRTALVDADGDNMLSPLDVLTVINAINNGEGVGELAEVRYRFFSVKADGTADQELTDPTPNNGITEAVIGTGDRVIIRTQIKDLRAPTPSGVFSAYHDLSFTNADGSTDEKLQLQWGEFNQLDVLNNVRSGTFTLTYGTETTAPIAIAFNNGIYSANGTVTNIRTAIQALPSVGTGNVRVSSLNSPTSFRFGINFIGQRARTNFVDPVVGANNLSSDGSGAVTLTVTGQANPDPTSDLVSRVARNHNLDNGTFIDGTGTESPVTRYTNGPDGVLKSNTPSATRTMTLLGGFSSVTSFLDPSVASRFLNVVDVLFVGGGAGVINLNGDTSPLPQPGAAGDNLGIALFGARAVYLTSTEVILPTATLIIADRLTAVTDSRNIPEDSGQSSIDVIANDIDRFGTSRGVVGVTQPSVGGTVAFVNNGQNVSFTPTADYFGPVTFTYTVRNNVTPTPDTAVGTVTINVTPVNDPPTIVGTQFSVEEDVANPLVLTPAQLFTPGPANESAQAVTIQSFTTGPQTNGTVSIVAGNINFLPAANFFGNAIFQVTGADDGSPIATRVSTITVNVAPVNDAPIANNAIFSVVEDGSVIISGTGAVSQLLSNANPGPGEAAQSLIILGFGAASNGGTITTVGSVVTYRPAPNFFGVETATYTVQDNGSPALAATGTITFNVSAVNDPPTAVNDTGAGRFTVLGLAQPSNLDVLANDSPGPLETDVLRIVSVTTPDRGTATINDQANRVVYTPPGDANSFNTTARFSYTIEDAGGLRSTADVEVFIIPPILPFAVDNVASIAEDSPAFTIDVIADDIGNSGATKRLVSFTQPDVASGSVALDDRASAADPTDDRLIYTPAPNFFGNAIFTYTMTDDAPGSDPSTATVTITVTPVNDLPTAAERTFAATEDTVLTIPAASITDGLSKGPFEDSQTLTITGAENLTTGSGTVVIVGGDVRYTAAPDFNGQVLVRYTVTDNGLTGTTLSPLSASSTLTINVQAINDAPIAVADTPVSTAENTPVTIVISSLLANDRPGPANESPPQTVTIVALGTMVITTAQGGSVRQSGTDLIYTPANSFNGPDSFVYQITDGLLNAPATLTVNVSEVNDAPTAGALTRSVFASVPTVFDVTQDLAGMPKGPANESGQTLRVSRVIPNPNTVGTVVLNANGTITYTAPLGANGLDTFQYEVVDNGTTNGVADPKTSIATFNVNISPFIPSTIRGVVYVDDNNSGAMDSNELRMGGIEVTLTVAATPSTALRTVTEMTHVDGTYSFDLLPPGAYTVTYAVPILATDAPGANSFTRTIVAPGGVNAEFNFSILGITPRYAGVIENLASSFYNANGSLRTSGVYAAIGANGKSEWTITRDGFAGDVFQEVVLSNDGTRAYLTGVRGADRGVYTATLNRQQFVQVQDPTGARLIRILARGSDLNWQQVSLAAPPVEITSRARTYLDTVDELFAQEGW